MRSMLADQPYSEVVKTHGESAIRELTRTFSTLSPKTSFISLVNGSNSAFNSSIFFFSSSSSMSRPSLVVLFNFLRDFLVCVSLDKTGGLGWWYGVGRKAFFLHVSFHFFNSCYHNFKAEKMMLIHFMNLIDCLSSPKMLGRVIEIRLVLNSCRLHAEFMLISFSA